MVRRNKDSIWGIVVVALVFLGLAQIMRSGVWTVFVLPAVILGGILLLYLYPPGRARGYRASNPKPKPSSRTTRNHAKPRSRKPAPFKVIEGGKDDDQYPRYH
ncbi:hypothetical protein DFQ01_104238 [Paenibacillus cellulosilyticus]|uniref:DUF2207 domain-containing protein n=1 Tax=Paenibacillus cellulosilyticus TaxID=375489 RepID=A0A2V2YW61_9BACL|nr:hypothetical protein [Paenibacillus cellulosilyticus]PWW05677.1 hypothetical protein DFQ01_104238 [Paenibacillus cellulosilyticus]QKS45300.1 hypothetical protein HUB94_13405 [Paenibacillus cellulosilyticus]